MVGPQLFLLLSLGAWLECLNFVLAKPTTESPIFFCVGTPCQAPGYCCGNNNESCCTSSHSSTSTSTSSGAPWYVFVIVAIVVIGVGAGIAVGVWMFLRRRRRVPYSRST